MKLSELEMPMNANERFLHAVAQRLDVIIHQNNSIVDGLSRLLKETPESNVSEAMTVQTPKTARKKK